MRILFYNHAGEVSGAERVLLTMLQHLPTLGVQWMLGAPAGVLLEAAARFGGRTAAIAPLVLGRTRNPLVLAQFGLQAGSPVMDLARLIAEFRPDVVYANSLRSGLVAVVAARSARRRPQVFVHLHDPVPSLALDRAAAWFVGRLADRLIVVSRYVADGFPRERAKVHVLYNAVDPDQFQVGPERPQALRDQLTIPRDAPLLAVVGQLTPWKGQLEALEALAAVRKAEPRAHLLIAGSAKFTGRYRRYDTRAYEAALHRRSAEPDLAGAVRMSGEIRDVAAVYGAATIVLVPSWYEAFAMVVLEALAAQRPIIACASGGNLEIIQHGVEGWLVPPRDPSALSAASLRLLRDAPLRGRLATAGFKRVREHHTIGQYMSRFAEILGLP